MGTRVDWSMGSRAAVLIDWRTASDTARRVGGTGPRVQAVERATIREELAGSVAAAESLVSEFAALHVEGSRARAWVMSRGEWADANLRGLQRLLEPLAARLLPEGQGRSEIRRKALGAQLGALLGYVSRKVLGQYDVFLPPDDEGLLYFVGPNVIEAERRFGLTPKDFRLWISLHEVTHRVQFGATPWLKPALSGMIDRYLATIEIDSKAMREQLRHAIEEIRAGADWRGASALTLLMTEEQRSLFHRMQALMSLLEGHASFVMNEVARGRVRDLERMRRSLKERRQAGGVEKAVQRAIGFETKVMQYDAGERFVRACVEAVGISRFNQVWKDEANLPTMQEIAEPARWLARVPNLGG
jgi:coenzyme F420 biosynthesis associated uncharacterized protein